MGIGSDRRFPLFRNVYGEISTVKYVFLNVSLVGPSQVSLVRDLQRLEVNVFFVYSRSLSTKEQGGRTLSLLS